MPVLLERTACLLQHKEAWQSAAARAFSAMALQIAGELSSGKTL
jgi:LysR family cyn operon transcriptional activator